ncbi:MAG: YbgA family protein [Symbiopectobacterium sp.]
MLTNGRTFMMSAPIPVGISALSACLLVGISACLLGVPVRFDGGHKRFDFAVYQLAPYCPFSASMPRNGGRITCATPRAAGKRGIRLCASNGSGIDITDEMLAFSDQKMASLRDLCGFILCAKSPSCDMERVKVYDSQGKNARKSGEWLFAQALKWYMPWLPLEENGRLSDPVLRENFIARVYALHKLQQIWQQGLSRGALMGFHSRYKLLLLVHSQPEYRELGPFVAGMAQWPTLKLLPRNTSCVLCACYRIPHRVATIPMY